MNLLQGRLELKTYSETTSVSNWAFLKESEQRKLNSQIRNTLEKTWRVKVPSSRHCPEVCRIGKCTA